MNGEQLHSISPSTHDEHNTHDVVIRVFGALGVQLGDEVETVGGPRLRRLLALLLLRPGRTSTVDELAEQVWDDSDRPDDPEPALRTYVSRIRRELPEEVRDAVETVPGGYRWAGPPEQVEHVRFWHLRIEAAALRETGDPSRAPDLLDEALGLWRGRPFVDLDDVVPARAVVEGLEVDRLEAEEERFELELELGRHTQIIGRLTAFAAEHPTRDRAAGQLALALHRSGRTSDAIRALHDHRRRLRDETGLDPSPSLVELERQLLEGDPALDVPDQGAPLHGYQLLDRIGAGTFSIVWRAVQPSVNREVAIKQIRADLAARPDFVRRFEAEAHLVARIEHPNVVPLIDYWRDPDSAYLVMRWLRGGSLEDRLRRGPLPLDDTLRMLNEIGGALVAAHDRGVIHRDVKTGNILFDEVGVSYLTDFGIAVDTTDPDFDARELSIGSPAFASPEQQAHQPLDARADIFSLGVVAAEALLGGPGGTGAHPVESLRNRDDLPPHVIDAIARAMAPDPADRFPTVPAFFDGLHHEPSNTLPSAPGANPYVGLLAFDEADADRFFGRDALVAQLTDATEAHNMVTVVGPSGSGKSSVVRAGLLPALRRGAVPGSDEWFIATMLPGGDPIDAFETALLRVAVNPPASLRSHLAREGGLLRAVRRVLPDDRTQLLMVIDQFEELFTQTTDDALRARFLDELAAAVRASGSPLRIVATIRADHFDVPLRHPGLAEIVNRAAVAVRPLTPEELEQVIVGPAAQQGVDVEPALVAELVADTAQRPAALPLLQFALTELYERRVSDVMLLSTHHELGDLTGALAARADRIIQTGGPDDEAEVRRIFGRLVTLGEGTEDTRRRARLAEFGRAERTSWLIDEFVGARLLATDRDPASREPTIEIAHEALLRDWPRLRGWIDVDRADLRTLQQVGTAARTWSTTGRDDGDLARGGRLEIAADLANRHPDWLNPMEAAWVDASQQAEQDARERDRRHTRRLRRALVTAASLAVVAVIAATVALISRHHAEEQERVAVARELAAASAAVVNEDPELAILLALEAIDRTGESDGTVLPEAEAALHQAVTSSRIVMSLPGLGGAVDWSPDGTMFITEGPEESGLIDLRDPETGESVHAFTGHDADINEVAFNADGSLLATTGDDGLVRVWDTDTWSEEAELGGSGQVWGASFSPDGSKLAAAWVNEGLVRVLDLATGEQSLEIEADTAVLTDSTSFSPDGSRLAIADHHGVDVVDTVTGDELLHVPLESSLAVGWSPDGRWIASAGPGVTRLTDAETGAGHLTLTGHTDAVHRFDWTSDGSRLATGSRDGSARVWELAEGSAVEVTAVAAREGPVGGVAFSPDGEQLLTGDVRVTSAKIWDVGIAGGAEWANLPTSSQVRGKARFTPGRNDLVVTGDGTPAVVWDLARFQPRRMLGANQGGAWEIEVSPDGELVATVSFEQPPRAHVWDRSSGSVVFTVQEDGFFPDGLTWSPDGDLLAVAGFTAPDGPGRIRILDRTGQQVTEIVEDGNFTPTDLAFTPDGEQLVTRRVTIDREDPTIDGVRVWDWANGEVVTDLPVFANSVAIDPTGTRIATTDVALNASIWDVATGERLATLTGHNGDVHDVAFSPDGDTIATSGADGTVRLWGTESGTEELVLQGHDGPVWSVDFGPEGERLVTTGVGVVRVWALELADLTEIATGQVTRTLTDDECRRYLHLDRCPEAEDQVAPQSESRGSAEPRERLDPLPPLEEDPIWLWQEPDRQTRPRWTTSSIRDDLRSSSFWGALKNTRDPNHSDALAILSAWPTERLITSNHVQGETWTWVRQRLGHPHAIGFLDSVLTSARTAVAHMATEQEDAAWHWLRRHDRGDEYSFVDATSFMFMEDMRITSALAFDDSFSATGFTELRA